MSSVEILVPDLPESVVDATVTMWYKKPGDYVNRDELLVGIETDKVVLEVPASADGILEVILEHEGSIVQSRQILCRLKLEQTDSKSLLNKNLVKKENNNDLLSPAVRRLIAENNIDINHIKGSGVKGRITSKDIERYLTKRSYQSNITTMTDKTNINRFEKRVPMTRLRKRVAERLMKVKNNTAILTTFNEVNMKPIMELRKKYGDVFEKRYGIRLGLMSFYVKAVIEALKRFPEINASIDGDDIIYHNYFDISIAISTPRGLVTPVLKNVDTFSMADIESKIKELALKGRAGKLTIDELTGGNFTITNGGIFGSLMSTPILNPPQSAILGMHAIIERPIAVNGQVVIQPMMYLALSYDHCLIDGRESVSYLVTIKEILEDPARLLLDV